MATARDALSSHLLRTLRLYDFLYNHNFLGFSTRLQSYTNYLGYLYLPPYHTPPSAERSA